MQVRVMRTIVDAPLPYKKHSTDAGWDLYAVTKTYDDFGNVVYDTGLAFEIPEGYVGLLFPRSSVAEKDLILSNCVGVIDSGYRGSVSFKFKNLNEEGADPRFEYSIGDRIGQLIIMPYPDIKFDEVFCLTDSDRGTGGYGSTGK